MSPFPTALPSRSAQLKKAERRTQGSAAKPLSTRKPLSRSPQDKDGNRAAAVKHRATDLSDASEFGGRCPEETAQTQMLRREPKRSYLSVGLLRKGGPHLVRLKRS